MLQLPNVLNTKARVGVGGWLDQVGIRLTQLSTGLKVEAELGKKHNKIQVKFSHLKTLHNGVDAD